MAYICEACGKPIRLFKIKIKDGYICGPCQNRLSPNQYAVKEQLTGQEIRDAIRKGEERDESRPDFIQKAMARSSKPAEDDRYRQVREYKKLYDEGIITEEEYERKKKELLDLRRIPAEVRRPERPRPHTVPRAWNFLYTTPRQQSPINMALWQGESRRKPTGGRLVFSHGKRKFEMSREKLYTRLTTDREAVRKQYRGMGGSYKVGMLTAQYANVVDKKTNTVKKVLIKNVVENPSDPNFVQRNIINKGAKIDTELGIAIVTSRPGQVGAVNAVLLN